MRAVLKLFRTNAPEPIVIESKVLPTSVLEAIDAASLVPRSAREDGIPRVVVMWGGNNSGWFFSDEAAAVAFQRLFPDLSPRLVGQAVQRLRGRVKHRLMGIAQHGGGQPTAWRDRF